MDIQDISDEYDFDPTEKSMLRFSCDLTYNQLFLQTAAFINENSDNNKSYLEYPKLYLMSKKIKCDYRQSCKQCYSNINTSNNNNNKLILCATKRRQLADALCDSGQEQKCMSDSLKTTTVKLYANDKTLIQQSDEYKLQSNWFVKVYSFLKWQQEAITATLRNLVYFNVNSESIIVDESKDDSILMQRQIKDAAADGDDEKLIEYITTGKLANTKQNFDLLTLLHSYLDELIEYLIIYYTCFDSQLWISVFYPFVEIAVGTLDCTMLFAESKTSDKAVTSLFKTAIDINGAEFDHQSKQNVIKEMRSISMFKLLLYNVCEANNSDIADAFDLTHKIYNKLEENTDNIKTQHLIQLLADDNVIHVDDSKIQEDIILHENRKDDWIVDSKIDSRIDTRVKVPSFIRLFIISRIIRKHITGQYGLNMKKLDTLVDSKFKDKPKAKSKIQNILRKLIKKGIKQYMQQWHKKSQQTKTIEIIFDKVIMQQFAKEYYNEITYNSTKINDKTNKKKLDYAYQKLVFKVNDLMCNIFQHLDYGRYFDGDLFNCSLVCSVWLYSVYNVNSVYYVDISELVNGKLPSRTWQRLYNAKFIRCGPQIWINDDKNDKNNHVRTTTKELSIFSSIVKICFFVGTESMIILKTIMSKHKQSIKSCDIGINSTEVDVLSPLKIVNAQQIVIRDLHFYRIWSSNCQILKIQHKIDKQWCYFVIKNCNCSGVVELHLNAIFDGSFDINGKHVLTKLASKFDNLKKLHLYYADDDSKEHVMVFTKALNSNVTIVKSEPNFNDNNSKTITSLRSKEVSAGDEGEGLIVVMNKYQTLEELGTDGYSRFILAADKDNGMLVALQILLSEPTEEKNAQGQITNIKWEISKSKHRLRKRELTLIKRIDHDNVIKLIDLIDDATFPQKTKDNKTVETPCLCIVLEYCSNRELFDYLMYAGGLGSRVTRTYFHQLLNGLKAIHKAGYVHRDLKPENLLLDDNYHLKISGLGFSTQYKNSSGQKSLQSTCGTRGYWAPELIKGESYTHMVDLFAVGIIMFTTFAGFPPFQHAGRGDWWWDKMEKAWGYWQAASQLNDDTDKPKKAEKIAKGNQKMKLFWAAHERSCKFSDSFKDLMQYLLNPNPKLRYDIAQCFDHPWLKGKTLDRKQLKKTMKKHSEKVNKQRTLKIKEQLETCNCHTTR